MKTQPEIQAMLSGATSILDIAMIFPDYLSVVYPAKIAPGSKVRELRLARAATGDPVRKYRRSIRQYAKAVQLPSYSEIGIETT